MRTVAMFIFVMLSSGLASCDDISLGHVLEVHCIPDAGLDQDKRCAHPYSTGAELAFTVNERTQNVQITIVKNDGNWWVKDFILDHCAVIDDLNWKCEDVNGKPGDTFYMAKESGTSHGRYYRSLVGGNSPDIYTSSINGGPFLKLHFGLIDTQTALADIGYSKQDVLAFPKN